MFCSVRGSDRCYIGIQPLYFQQMALSKDIRLKRGFLYLTVALRPHKWPELAKKTSKITQKCHVPLCQGTRQMLHWQPTILFWTNDPK